MLQLLSRESRIFQLDNSPFAETLSDIVTNIEIDSDFSINHPGYKSFELPKQIADRLNYLPENLRDENLSRFLCNFLYGIYYNSSLKAMLSSDRQRNDIPLADDLENNSYLDMDVEFSEKLHDHNCGSGYYDQGWLVVQIQDERNIKAQKNGLTLLIETDKYLHESERSCKVGDTISLLMPKNLMQNGFYMAVCDRGANHRDFPPNQKQTVRLYFNVSADGSPLLMQKLTTKLNRAVIEFTYKTLYNPNEYKRCDAGVLYVQKPDYATVHSLISSVYNEIEPCLGSEVPLFTKKLAPGIGLAEEPIQNTSEVESFGSHRCRILAKGFLKSWKSKQDSPENRLQEILKHFELMQISLEQPYLNPGSDDIYTKIKE